MDRADGFAAKPVEDKIDIKDAIDGPKNAPRADAVRTARLAVAHTARLAAELTARVRSAARLAAGLAAQARLAAELVADLTDDEAVLAVPCEAGGVALDEPPPRVERALAELRALVERAAGLAELLACGAQTAEPPVVEASSTYHPPA